MQDALGVRFDEMTLLLPNLVAAAFVLLATLLLGSLAGRAIDRFSDDRSEARATARVARRVVGWTLNLVGLVLALELLGLTGLATSLLATGGLAAVVLGFAFREIGENLLAGLMLGLSRSFEVGDLIESSGQTGKVVDIQVRHVHLRTADGRDVFVPSASILRNVLVNFTRDGLRRGEFTIGLDYADPLGPALERALAAVRRVDGVLTEPTVSARIETFESQYVALKILFWVDTDAGAGLSGIRSEAMRVCLEALRDAGMTVSADVSSALTVAPLDVRVLPVADPRGADASAADGR